MCFRISESIVRTTMVLSSRLALGSLLVLAVFLITQPLLGQTPDFGPNVYIIDPSMSSATIVSTLTSLSNEAQFSTNRYAVLFLPGTYTVQAPVGYYESIAGLGETPSGVTINGFLTPNFGSTYAGANLTTTFWRSMENMTFNVATDTAQSAAANTLQWGVSQGAPLRRLQINGSLELVDSFCGEASGGFISDTVVTGNVNPCSQQQWYTRNSSIGSWSGGVWNMVFSGVQGAPTPNYPTNKYTVLPTTPASREKPFLYVDSGDNYNVFVPSPQTNSLGTTWANGSAPGYSIPISQFFIAQPSTTLAAINNALLYGQNLILTPGIYQYNGAINITNPNTIVLGLGYATLVPQNGTAAITVADVDGVQIAGLIIDAGPISSPVLLQIGVPGGAGVSHQSNPTTINDVFLRIGGATVGTAATSMEIDSDNVILDDIWSWRADHGAGSTPIWTGNPANNGVVVDADNVTALGLAVEHYEQNQVVWNGNGGETIFYQSELPYDVPSQSQWMNGSANGYSSYSVSSSVTSHAAYGLGVYSFFDQGLPIIEDSAITVPNTAGVTVTDAVSVFLSGSGQITYTVDNAGTVAKSGSTTSYVPFYQGVPCSTTCPAAPSDAVATPISPSQINLTWAASSTPGVVYYIFRSTTPGFTPSAANQVVSGVAGLSYADTTASPSTTYNYLIEAVNAAGFSAPSNLATASTQANGGTIAPGNDVVKIDAGYTGSTPPAGWLTDRDFSGPNAVGTATSNAITIPGSIANPAPQAVYQTNRRSNGGTLVYTIPGLTPGGAYIVDLHFSENFQTAANLRKFNVSINGSQVLTNFDIFATTGGRYIANVQSFYAVADATGTIVIQFTATANNAQVNGIEIGLGNVSVPVAPSDLAASSSSDSEIDLSWSTSPTSSVVYELFRSTTPGFQPSPTNLVTTTSTTSFADTGLAASTTYYYAVEASDSILTSLPSNQASAATESAPTTPPTTPAAPTGLGATAVSSREIDLLWTGSSTPSVQYQVFRSTTPGFAPSSANQVTTTSATGYADVGLAGATSYYYVVEAFNDNGNSPASNQASAQTQGPSSITVVSGSGQTAQVDMAFANPLVVLVQDAEGNPVLGVTVMFSGASVIFPGGTTAVTDSSGQAQLFAEPDAIGSLTISAAVAGVTTPAIFSETGTAIPQTITFGPLPGVTYGVVPIALTASASSGLPVSYSATGPATVSGSTLTITGAGFVTVTASQAGNTRYAAATPVVQSFTVMPAVLTVTANSVSVPFGTTPALSATITGFVNGDTISVVSGAPALATTANALSLPGIYPITVGLGTLSAANYSFTFVSGTYTVTFTAAVPSTGTHCNGAYSGTFSGNITVSSGQVCAFVGGAISGNVQLNGGNLILVQSQVGGNVQLMGGGTFTIGPGTTIKGNLQIQNLPSSALQNQVCGTTVQGNLQFQNNGTAVLIGSASAPPCPGNTVGGNLQVQNNTAAVTIVGNTVDGNLQVSNNTADTTITGNTVNGNLQDDSNGAPTAVFTNTVGKNLQCNSNTSITGGGNTAGKKQDQCSSF
ncbi:MAG: malectin domain-containing carbohydrate-binding protein [Candidatus Acidiferrales bacterium]